MRRPTERMGQGGADQTQDGADQTQDGADQTQAWRESCTERWRVC